MEAATHSALAASPALLLGVCAGLGLPAVAASAPQCVSETAHVIAGDAEPGDVFGHSVGVDGTTLVSGAYFDDDVASGCGAAYVHVLSGGVWTQQAKLLPSDGTSFDRFGWHVDVNGDTAVVACIFGDGLAAVSGTAYVYVRSGTVWSEQAKLVSSDGASSDWFGRALAISGDTIVVGAPQDDDSGSNSGAAYVYVRTGTVWTEQPKLVASDAAAGDNFGEAVAIDGDTLVVGSPYDDDLGSSSGSAYVFTRSGGVWSQQAKLLPSDGDTLDAFGWRVAVDGASAVVGAYKSGLGSSTGAGAAYVFTRSGAVWSQQAKLSALDGASGDNFGWPVAIRGDLVAVGAPLDAPAGAGSGSAYLYARVGAAWSEVEKLVASDAAAGDGFALSLDVDAGTIAVGAYQDDTPAGSGTGSAYVFERLPQPVAYCTAGLTSSGCSASISGLGTPSASAPSGFTLLVGAMEGDKQGVLFYGVNGRAAAPWGASGSYLCVAPPTQRMVTQTSTGTAGVCNGTMSIDWNDYRTTNPGALGAPFGAGDTVWAQGWFRDPPSPKTTHLSNALEFVLCN